MRIRAALVALTLPLAGAATVPALAGNATSNSWLDTATRALPLAQAGAHLLGPAESSTPLRLAITLKLRDSRDLQQFIAAGRTVTPAQFAARWSPTMAQAAAVVAYLRHEGFRNVATMPNRLVVTADATVAQAQRAFHTRVDAWTLTGHKVIANTTTAQLPRAVAGDVTAVLGLQTAAHMMRPTISRHPAQTTRNDVPEDCLPAVPGLGQTACTFTPKGFWNVYDATKAPTGAKTDVAIFSDGNVTGVIKDLRLEEKANGLPAVPVTVHKEGPGSSSTAGADEYDMDTQYSTGMADVVKRLHIYTATTLLDPDLTVSLAQFVTDDVARAGSMSFGECEYEAELDGTLAANDELFAEAAAQGQTVFASAGDTGGFCPLAPNNGVPLGAPMQGYPASSPYVVAVGGTSVYPATSGGYGTETAWLAGGGGPSLVEAMPGWQSGIAPPTDQVCQFVAAIPTGCGRTVPDIAMSADSLSGAADVYVDGQKEAIGGTSLASPLALGVWARVLSATGNRIGFAPPKLYALHTSAAFHDVTLGDNGPYPATPGYDLATGIGSLDVAKAVAAFSKLAVTRVG